MINNSPSVHTRNVPAHHYNSSIATHFTKHTTRVSPSLEIIRCAYRIGTSGFGFDRSGVRTTTLVTVRQTLNHLSRPPHMSCSLKSLIDYTRADAGALRQKAGQPKTSPCTPMNSDQYNP